MPSCQARRFPRMRAALKQQGAESYREHALSCRSGSARQSGNALNRPIAEITENPFTASFLVDRFSQEHAPDPQPAMLFLERTRRGDMRLQRANTSLWKTKRSIPCRLKARGRSKSINSFRAVRSTIAISTLSRGANLCHIVAIRESRFGATRGRGGLRSARASSMVQNGNILHRTRAR